MEMIHELITPARAKKMLEKQALNRNLGTHTWRYYLKEMNENRWKDTGEPLQFNTKDELMNGQHRLTALIKGNHSLRFWCCYGVPDDAMGAIDTGKSRNAQDYLTMQGVPNSAIVAAIIRMKSCYKAGRMSLLEEHSNRLDHDQIFAQYLELPHIISSVAVARNLRDVGPGSVLGFCHHEIGQVDKVGADEFFFNLKTGANLAEESPILFCRNRLQRLREAKAHLKNMRPLIVMTVFKCWNAYAQGRSIKLIKFLVDEKFPKILPRALARKEIRSDADLLDEDTRLADWWGQMLNAPKNPR